MTTNFSQTANVGKVEEMNCPNLDGYKKKSVIDMTDALSSINNSP